MLTLLHHPLCPQSRYVRLMLGEYGIEARLVEERFWERREEFLLLNPAGEIPVLVQTASRRCPAPPSSRNISHETHGDEAGKHRLMPAAVGERVEVRRLASWFNDKFHAEVSGPLVTERVFKRHMTREQGGGPPDTEAMRAARQNIRYHLAYIGWLVQTRDWLAGDRLSLADLAAAGASVGRRLSGRCAVERRRGSEELVRAGEVAALVPPAAGRHAGRSAAGEELRRSRLLTDPDEIKAALIEQARARGFDVVGVTRPDAVPEAKARLERFLADGAHGDMVWMETTAERRGAPTALWPDVRSVIMLGHELRAGRRPAGDLARAQRRAAISVLRQGRRLSRPDQAAAEGRRALAGARMPAATSRSSSTPRR